MDKQYIIPVVGHIYRNRNGGEYHCTGNTLYMNDEQQRRALSVGDHVAYMERVKDGWQLSAHGIIQYEDGTIEWNYSTNGHFWALPVLKPVKQMPGETHLHVRFLQAICGEAVWIYQINI